MTGGAGGHDVETFGLGERKITGDQGVLKFGRGLLDDVAAVAAGPSKALGVFMAVVLIAATAVATYAVFAPVE